MGQAELAGANRVILILGMHRSGTSLCVRSINFLGAALSADLIMTRPDNPRGYYEDRRMVEINSKIIRLLFAQVHEEGYPLVVQMRPWPLQPRWMQRPEVLAFRAEMLPYVRRHIEDSAIPWCIKDPRLCRLYPFWADIFQELGVRVDCVVSIRHPGHVAASLADRDGILPDQAELQWLIHTLDAVFYAREIAAVIDYGDWFSEPSETIRRLVACLGLNPSGKQISRAVANIDGESNHAGDGVAIRHPFAREAYELLRAARHGPLDRARLLAMRDALYEAFSLLAGCYDELAFAANQQRKIKGHYRVR